MLDQQIYVIEKVRQFQELHWAGRPLSAESDDASRAPDWRRVLRLKPAVEAGRGLLQRLASA